jgi:hypothetical protein
MNLKAHDQGFVAASPGRVYGALADLGGYPAWWAGATSDPESDRVRLGLEPGRGVEATAERRREGLGLFLRLGPPLHGTLEWYLEPFEEGTMVNCFLDVEPPGGRWRASRRLPHLRAGVRRGLVGLKMALE